MHTGYLSVHFLRKLIVPRPLFLVKSFESPSHMARGRDSYLSLLPNEVWMQVRCHPICNCPFGAKGKLLTHHTLQVTAYCDYRRSSEAAYLKRKTTLNQNARSITKSTGRSNTVLTGLIAGGLLLALLAARFLHYGWVALWAVMRKT